MYDDNISPCYGCEDYNPLNDNCKSNGGCAAPRWILEIDMQFEKDGFPAWYKWICSECGYIRTAGWASSIEGRKPKAKYCENCGVKM